MRAWLPPAGQSVERHDYELICEDAPDAITALLDEVETLREVLRKITHEHLQFATYFEPEDWAAQMEARTALSKHEGE